MNDMTMVKPDLPEVQKKKLDMAAKKLPKIIKSILNKERKIDIEPINFMLKSRNQPFRESVHQESVHYKADESCNGCSICEKICPSKNIKIEQGKPTWGAECELCTGCFHYCPKQSISFKERNKELAHYHHPEIGVKELANRLN
jgi:MinD superfamily P-loop ATPase